MPRVRRSNPEGLPPRVYRKHGGYYYVTLKGKWERLGAKWDLPARSRWAELAGETAPAGGVRELVDLWKKEMLPQRARRTQLDNLRELDNLMPVFGGCAVNEVTLPMARKYLKLRGRQARVRANREVNLLGQIYRWGMNEGYAPHNPCEGVIYHKEVPRTRRVTSDEFDRYLNFARAVCPPDAAVLWLMDLTGQRRGDIIALRRAADKKDGLEVIQSKTGVKLLIEWSPELRAAVNYALGVHQAELAKKKIAGLYLLCTRDGVGYTDSGIKSLHARTMRSAMDCERGPPVVIDRFRVQDIRPKAISDVGGGKRGKDLAGHRVQATTDRIYDRVTFKRVKPTR